VGSFRSVQHPIVDDLVRQLRSTSTSNLEFNRLASELTRYVAYEAFRELPTVATTVDTPVEKGAPARALQEEFVLVPILRAGLGMTPSAGAMLPHHRLCLLGLRRNEETLQPDIYLDGLPKDLAGARVVVCDPMLATGGSLVFALDLLRQRGSGPVTVLCLIAAQPGVDRLLAAHPEANIVAAALDAHLNDVGYITPGLGDAGDRLFGPPVR
jgi:uracil phosphoribosyltransferase